MVRSRPAPPPSPPCFVDEAAKEHYQTIKNRRVFFELGFVFSEAENANLGSEVLDVVTKHKWQKFAKHPVPVNATIVKEFYSNITEPNQHAVMVRGISIRFTPTAINRYFKLQVADDHNTSFAQEVDHETYQGILEDLCLPGTRWNGQQLKRKTVDRDRLLPHVKLWNHFMKHKLMPTSHNTTVSCQRMLLLHSILTGRTIDIGKIIVEHAHLCLKRQASALVFPNLITALCRKKKVREEMFDEILSGIAGLNKAKIPMLLGYKEAKGKKHEATTSRVASSPHVRASSTDLEQAVQRTHQHVGQLSDKLMVYFAYAKRRDAFLTSALMESIRRLRKASQHQEPPLPTVQECPRTPPAAPASDFEHSSPAKLRKRTRRATVTPPPASVLLYGKEGSGVLSIREELVRWEQSLVAEEGIWQCTSKDFSPPLSPCFYILLLGCKERMNLVDTAPSSSRAPPPPPAPASDDDPEFQQLMQYIDDHVPDDEPAPDPAPQEDQMPPYFRSFFETFDLRYASMDSRFTFIESHLSTLGARQQDMNDHLDALTLEMSARYPPPPPDPSMDE
ncbi:hypothetical protein F3Y22_tig00110733pilonHSYRG00282 [Hibiscus syriacus]|uniref:Putative plant transposon protein domain-containing protein n=1 Tax=Hibiscus syriacus TaxID=106335 RepID=A0A6A2ZUE4_HIBSY|nr:hypothetical protein F3Y22_tig00110733pilonHSYRG00282 [Hibiscus syriacus]